MSVIPQLKNSHPLKRSLMESQRKDALLDQGKEIDRSVVRLHTSIESTCKTLLAETFLRIMRISTSQKSGPPKTPIPLSCPDSYIVVSEDFLGNTSGKHGFQFFTNLSNTTLRSLNINLVPMYKYF